MLLNYGFDPYVYNCHKTPDTYNQQQFFDSYQIKTVSDITTYNWLCGFIVSVYPNPQASIQNNLPNIDPIILNCLENRLIYICHRFKSEQDYSGPLINNKNSLCLSPLSKKINVDHIYLTNYTVSPNFHNYRNETIKLGIQGHFEFSHRNLSNIQDILFEYNKSQILEFILLGTNSKFAQHQLTQGSLGNCNIRCYAYEDINEIDFYSKLNSLHWIIPAIDPTIKNSTYSVERFSSSFNHALALEKPIICHEFFQSIYQMPGLYYNDKNFSIVFNQLINQSHNEYNQLIQKIKESKNWMNKHNKKIIENKIQLL